MRAGRSAAVGVVTELVDVHASVGVGIVAGDVVADGGWRGLGGLFEGDGTLDVGVTPEYSNLSGTLVSCGGIVKDRGVN